jgi:hypothetical protein
MEEAAPVMQQWNTKHPISIAVVMQATIEELWEAVFSEGPCRGYIWIIESQLSQSRITSLQLAVGRQTRQRLSLMVTPGGGAPTVVSCCIAAPSQAVR